MKCFPQEPLLHYDYSFSGNPHHISLLVQLCLSSLAVSYLPHGEQLFFSNLQGVPYPTLKGFGFCFLCNPLNSSPLLASACFSSGLGQMPSSFSIQGCWRAHRLQCQIHEGYLWPLQSSSRCLWWFFLPVSPNSRAVEQVKLCWHQIRIVSECVHTDSCLESSVTAVLPPGGLLKLPHPLQVPSLPSMCAGGQTATRCFFNTTFFKNSTQWRYAEFTSP